MPHGSLLGCSLKLSRKPSIESFISPTVLTLENNAKSGESSRNVHSMNRTVTPRKSPFPPIPLRRISTVNVRRQKTLALKSKWTRLCVKLTMHTISLHEDLQSDPFHTILLKKIKHVKRLDEQPCCLQVETDKDKVYFFAFDREEELYDWLTDISPINKPTDVAHHLHVEPDKEDQSRLVGLPEDWEFFSPGYSRTSITQEMIEAALPEIYLSEHQSMFDLDSNSDTPDSIFTYDESDDEEYCNETMILTAQRITQADTRHLVNLHSRLPYKINTDSEQIRSPSLRTPTEGSPLTPFLTPDTAASVSTPLTPFRESPYRYRETDAQDLTGQVFKLSEYAEEFGGFADIWHANWKTTYGQCIAVAVKVLRVHDQRLTDKIEKRLQKEVRVWHQLRHKNVVQMYGICEGFGRLPAMVSLWYTNGNVKKYLRKLGDGATVTRRLKLLKEVACGLNYLHTFTLPLSGKTTMEGHIVHGDLKGANILVNDHGEAALADFGLSSIRAEVNNSTSSTFAGGTVRFTAPELLFENRDHKAPKTCASDTYSYGSVILEILTDKLPYHEFSNDAQVIMELKNKRTPKRPTKPSVDSGVWDLMERCWSEEPSRRPDMAFVLSRMEKFYKEHRKSMLLEEDAA